LFACNKKISLFFTRETELSLLLRRREEKEERKGSGDGGIPAILPP
jgi:hypothetical protein